MLVPGYVDAAQVEKMAQFVAGIDHDIPYALLVFRRDFEMSDLPPTSRQEARECLAAAQAAGLMRVRISNLPLLL